MSKYIVHATSEDGRSGEDITVSADSPEQAVMKYEVAHGDSALPVVTAELLPS